MIDVTTISDLEKISEYRTIGLSDMNYRIGLEISDFRHFDSYETELKLAN
jgi:hypothetical protein